MELAAVGLEHRLFARLADEIVDLRLRLVVHLLDAGRMDASVLEQHRCSVSFATSRRMPSNDERTTACGVSSTMKSTPVEMLERADVASFATDDATLHVV